MKKGNTLKTILMASGLFLAALLSACHTGPYAKVETMKAQDYSEQPHTMLIPGFIQPKDITAPFNKSLVSVLQGCGVEVVSSPPIDSPVYKTPATLAKYVHETVASKHVDALLSVNIANFTKTTVSQYGMVVSQGVHSIKYDAWITDTKGKKVWRALISLHDASYPFSMPQAWQKLAYVLAGSMAKDGILPAECVPADKAATVANEKLLLYGLMPDAFKEEN